MDPVTAWWFQKLKDGTLPPGDEKWGIAGKNAIYEDYAETIGKAGVIHKGMQTSLAMKLKKLLPGQYPISQKRKVDIKEYFNAKRECYIITRKRIPHWQFPPLKECREHFEKIAKMKGYNWPDEPEFENNEEKPEF